MESTTSFTHKASLMLALCACATPRVHRHLLRSGNVGGSAMSISSAHPTRPLVATNKQTSAPLPPIRSGNLLRTHMHTNCLLGSSVFVHVRYAKRHTNFPPLVSGHRDKICPPPVFQRKQHMNERMGTLVPHRLISPIVTNHATRSRLGTIY